MKRIKPGKSRTASRKAASTAKKPLKPVDLSVVREQIAKLVGNRAVGMVKTTMNEVDKGHYLAMKYLFEMIGLCPAPPEGDAAQDDSLAKTLLRRLQLPELEPPGVEVAKLDTTETADVEDAIK